jgi:hypothetical protein
MQLCGAPRPNKVALLDVQDHVELPAVIHAFPCYKELMQAHYEKI